MEEAQRFTISTPREEDPATSPTMLVVVELVCGNAQTRVNIREDEMRADPESAALTLVYTAQQLVPGKKVQRLVYADDEGDMCTLAAETLDDALTQAQFQTAHGSQCGMDMKLLRLQGVVAAEEVESSAEPAAAVDIEPRVSEPAGHDEPAAPAEPAEPPAHHGVTCDRCGMKPILGNRYKKRDANYDLCEADFQLLPEAGRKQYMKMEQPQTCQRGPQPDEVRGELNRRFGWDEATIGSIKDSRFGAGMEGLQKLLSKQQFEKVAAAVEQLFGLPQDRVPGCLEEMMARLPALLVTENPFVSIQEAVADILAKAQVGSASSAASDLVSELHPDACRAVLRSLLNHENPDVSSAAAAAMREAAPAAPPSARTEQPKGEPTPAAPATGQALAEHTHVECDMCGVCPIMGPRYKKRWSNYDLCEEHFQSLPEDAREQFVRIEKPMCPRSVLQLEADGRAHFGIICDATNQAPIIGPRFKKLGEDYDLCEAAFDALSEEERSQFVRIERPQDAEAAIAQAEAERAAARAAAEHAAAHAEALQAAARAEEEHAAAHAKVVQEAALAEAERTAVQEDMEAYARLLKRFDGTPLEGVMKRLQSSVSQEQVAFAIMALEPLFQFPEHVKRAAFAAVEDRVVASCEFVDDAVVVTFFPDIVQDLVHEIARQAAAEAAAAATPAAEEEKEAPEPQPKEEGDGAAEEDTRSEGESSYAMPPSEASSCNKWELVEPEEAEVEAPVPVEELASKEPVAFNPAPRVERPATAARAVNCTIAVGNPHAMGEDAGGRGDVTEEYRALMLHYPKVTQVYRMGRVVIQRGAASSFEAKVYVRNTGSRAWPSHTSINIVAGPSLGFAQLSLGAVPAGDTAELIFDLNIEPREEREVLQSFWCMCDTHGEPFGPLLMLQTIVM